VYSAIVGLQLLFVAGAQLFLIKMFIQIILVCTEGSSFDYMPETINKIIGHIGNRFVRGTTSYGILVEAELTDADKTAIMEMAATPAKIEVLFIELPEKYEGTINNLYVK